MQKQGRTPSWLARKIYCDRTNIHKIYKKDSIDTQLLFNISKALNHNFFEDLSNNYKSGKIPDGLFFETQQIQEADATEVSGPEDDRSLTENMHN